MADNKGLPRTYTVSEVGQILHRTEQTIRRMIKEKKLPAIRIGGGYIITQETIDKILSGEIELRD
jgi:excisionase family DNA binding protein